jgi:hypothetical protein
MPKKCHTRRPRREYTPYTLELITEYLIVGNVHHRGGTYCSDYRTGSLSWTQMETIRIEVTAVMYCKAWNIRHQAPAYARTLMNGGALGADFQPCRGCMKLDVPLQEWSTDYWGSGMIKVRQGQRWALGYGGMPGRQLQARTNEPGIARKIIQ